MPAFQRLILTLHKLSRKAQEISGTAQMLKIILLHQACHLLSTHQGLHQDLHLVSMGVLYLHITGKKTGIEAAHSCVQEHSGLGSAEIPELFQAP